MSKNKQTNLINEIKEDKNISKEIKPKKTSQLIKDIKKLFFISNLKMKKKYDVTKNKYNKIVINTLLNSDNCHLVAIFKEQLLSNYYQEFLRRQYKLSEARERIPKFSGYYKNYLFFFCKPTFTNFQMNSIINNYGEKRAEIYYKKVYQGGKSSEEDENNDGFQESDSEEDSKSEQKNNNNETRLINTGIKEEIDNVTIMTTISSNGNNNTINLNLENEKIEVFSENKCEKSTDTTFHEILDVIAKKNNNKSSRKNKKFLTNISTMMEFKKAILAKRIANKNKHIKANTKSIINANTNTINNINNNENKNIHYTVDKKLKIEMSQNEQKDKSKISNKNKEGLKSKNDLKKSINKISLNGNNVFVGTGYTSLVNSNKSISPPKKNNNVAISNKKIVFNNNFIRDNIIKNTKTKKNYFKLSRNYNTNGLLYSNTTSNNQNCNYNYNFDFVAYKSDYNNLYNNKNTISLNKLNEHLKKENFSKTSNDNNNHFPSNSNEKVNRVSSLKFLVTENDKKKTNFKLYAGKLNNKVKNDYTKPLSNHKKNTNFYIGSVKNISKGKPNINSHKCLNNNLKGNVITSNNENIKYKHQHYNSLSNQININEINTHYPQLKKKNKINIPVPPLPIGTTVLYEGNSISSNNNNSGSVSNNIVSHCLNNENSGKKYNKNKNLKYYYNNNNYNININNQIIINTNANCYNNNINNKRLQNYISSRNKKTDFCLNDLQKGNKIFMSGNGGGVIANFSEKETKSKKMATHNKKLTTRNISSGLKYFNTNFNNAEYNNSKNTNIIKSYHCKNVSSVNQNQKLLSFYKSLNSQSGSKEKNNLKK